MTKRERMAAAAAARARVEAESSRQLAEAAGVRASIERRTPAVESVTEYLDKRLRRNGFGEQLTLSFTPRRPRTP